jgi:hypothetical protein
VAWDWKPIETCPEGVEVWTRIKDASGERNKQTLRRQGRLFFMPGGMYVYYTPTHWAPTTNQGSKRS